MKTLPAQRGFTLLEMLLALAVFALISLAGYQLLQGMQLGQQVAQQHNQRVSTALRLFNLLEQDLLNAFISPAQGESFITGDTPQLLQLTRRSLLNSGALSRSPVQKVAWRFSAQTLTRHHLSDGQQTAQFREISDISLRYFSAGRWQTTWQARHALPDAVEISVTQAGRGTLTRIIVLRTSAP